MKAVSFHLNNPAILNVLDYKKAIRKLSFSIGE
jgi:hypothetical protein